MKIRRLRKGDYSRGSSGTVERESLKLEDHPQGWPSRNQTQRERKRKEIDGAICPKTGKGSN